MAGGIGTLGDRHRGGQQKEKGAMRLDDYGEKNATFHLNQGIQPHGECDSVCAQRSDFRLGKASQSGIPQYYGR